MLVYLATHLNRFKHGFQNDTLIPTPNATKKFQRLKVDDKVKAAFDDESWEPDRWIFCRDTAKSPQ